MLNISTRTARLNQDYKGKSNEREGEVTKLLTFGLDEIELDERELCALNGDPQLHRGIYDTSKPEARCILKGFKPLQLEEDIEGAAVTVRLRGGAEYRFTGCTISKIRVNHANPGQPLLSCKVKTAPALDASVAEFIANMGELVDVELHGSQKTDQQDLPLNSHGTGEQTDGAKPKKRNGQQPAAH
jgi:hypothetical protein